MISKIYNKLKSLINSNSKNHKWDYTRDFSLVFSKELDDLLNYVIDNNIIFYKVVDETINDYFHLNLDGLMLWVGSYPTSYGSVSFLNENIRLVANDETINKLGEYIFHHNNFILIDDYKLDIKHMSNRTEFNMFCKNYYKKQELIQNIDDEF